MGASNRKVTTAPANGGSGLGSPVVDLSTPAPAPPEETERERAKGRKREKRERKERERGKERRGEREGESEEEREQRVPRNAEEKGEKVAERSAKECKSEGEYETTGEEERERPLTVVDGRNGLRERKRETADIRQSTETDEETETDSNSGCASESESDSGFDSESLSDNEELEKESESESERDREGKHSATSPPDVDSSWAHDSDAKVDASRLAALSATADAADAFCASFTPLAPTDLVPIRFSAEGAGSIFTFVPTNTTINSTRILLINQLQAALDVLNDDSHVVDVASKSVLGAKYTIPAPPADGRALHLGLVTKPSLDAGQRPAKYQPAGREAAGGCRSPELSRARTVTLAAQRTNDGLPDEQTATQIGNLLGNALYQATNGPQAINFRSKMAKVFSTKHHSDKVEDVMRARITNSKMPETIPEKILCKFYIAKKSTSNTVHAHVEDSFLDVVSRVVMSHARRQILSRSTYESDDFFVKIQGSSEYVLDDVPLGSIVRVRELVKNNMPVCFVLISKEQKKVKDQIDAFLKSEQEQLAASRVLDRHQGGVEAMLSQFTPVSEVRRPFELRIVAMEFTRELLEGEGEEEAEGNLSPRSPRAGQGGSRLNRSTAAAASSTALVNSSGGVGGGVSGGGGASQRYVFAECCLYHGVEPMAEAVRTKPQPKGRALFVESFLFDIQLSQLPRAARACFVLYEAASPSAPAEPIGWVNVQLVDYSNELRSGVLYLGLWCDSPPSPIGTCEPNSKSALALTIELPRHQLPILFVNDPGDADDGRKTPAPLRKQRAPSPEDQAVIEELLKQDALYQATEEEKRLMWKHRDYYRNVPRSTVKLLLSVPWNSAKAVKEAHQMLREWAPLNPYEGLELLDAKFADAQVRRFGVNCLAQLNHEELAAIMLQLVQVLKYEPYHDSALARFLLQRALGNRQLVGHAFFWHLHAELHVEQISERYVLLAEVYLRCAGDHRSELVKQLAATRRIHELALLMQKTPAAKRTHVLRTNLRCLGMPTKFKLPSNPRVEVQEVVIDKCKTKDSFTAPLWLVFKVRDMVPTPSFVPVIFKAGDDLRQDALTLQMLRLMDEVWKREGLDLHMSVYGVLASADAAGYIEVVQNAASLADIQKNAGGLVTAAFAKTPLQRWLQQHNPSEKQYNLAVKKFIFSCAGYSVGTYLLGLGDRHNDNIMVTTSGHLFHIDFAHFLGNIMKWKGIKRETAPFVLTPAIAHVMGGVKSEQFQLFTELCCRAFNILRKHSHVFITLFALMVSTGIPQLNSFEDIHFLRNAFMLHLSDAEAEAAFVKLIDKCLSSLATKVNFVVHLMAHPGKDT